MRAAIGWVTMTIGSLLLVVAIVGHFSQLGDYVSTEPREWEQFNEPLAKETRSWNSFSKEAARRVDSVEQKRGGGAWSYADSS